MANSTVLALIQQADGEMGLSVPTTAVGNTNADVIQQLGLMNAVGYELIRDYIWQATTKLNLFQTAFLNTTGNVVQNSAVITGIPSTAGLSTLYQVTGNGLMQNSFIQSVDSATQVTLTFQAQASGTAVPLSFSQTRFNMPADYDRQIDATHWDKTQHWRMIGPETAQQWEWLTSGYISSGPMVRYRIFGDYFQIWPPQGTQHYLGFEYISKYWALDALGVPKAAFTVDSDRCIFPDRLMVLGMKHKYFQAKGLGDIYMADFMAQKDIAFANDAGSLTLHMNPRVSSILIGWSNIPDSGFGS